MTDDKGRYIGAVGTAAHAHDIRRLACTVELIGGSGAMLTANDAATWTSSDSPPLSTGSSRLITIGSVLSMTVKDSIVLPQWLWFFLVRSVLVCRRGTEGSTSAPRRNHHPLAAHAFATA